MKVVTSKDNGTYRNACRLLRRKYREESGSYLLEGIKPLADACRMDAHIERIFVCEGEEHLLSAGSPDGDKIGPIDEDKVVILSRELFERLSDTENSQGVVGLIKRRVQDMEHFLESTGGGDLIILDRLQDPGNAGTIIRTAEAAGFTGVIALKGTVDLFAPKVVRAAAGSLFRMPVQDLVDEKEAVELMRTSGRSIAVTCVDEGIDCFQAEIRRPVALVIGNEGNGTSPGLIKEADMRLTIPMEGSIESLNAAVAAGILMYRINTMKSQQEA